MYASVLSASINIAYKFIIDNKITNLFSYTRIMVSLVRYFLHSEILVIYDFDIIYHSSLFYILRLISIEILFESVNRTLS